jgi:hypothetical protein
VPLTSLRGHHVATVTAPRIDTFKPYTRDETLSRGDLDQVIAGDAEVPSVRLALYANGQEPRFHADRIAFTLTAPWGQEELGADASVVVLAGFEPVADASREQSFVFLKGI